MNIELMKQSQIKCKRRAYEKQIEKLKEKYLYIENSNLIRFSNRCGSHINCFRFSLSENREHILKKLDICIELMNKRNNLKKEEYAPAETFMNFLSEVSFQESSFELGITAFHQIFLSEVSFSKRKLFERAVSF